MVVRLEGGDVWVVKYVVVDASIYHGRVNAAGGGGL